MDEQSFQSHKHWALSLDRLWGTLINTYKKVNTGGICFQLLLHHTVLQLQYFFFFHCDVCSSLLTFIITWHFDYPFIFRMQVQRSVKYSMKSLKDIDKSTAMETVPIPFPWGTHACLFLCSGFLETHAWFFMRPGFSFI